MPTWLTSFWASLGLIGVSTATVTGLAYWLFKLFGEKWLTQKFNERLESYKHEQQKSLEKLRLQISSTLDRTSKLHQYEFEALPKLWKLTTIAYGAVSHFVSPLQFLADLNRMTQPALEEFLEKSELAEWEKNEVRNSKDKTKEYANKAFWVSLNKSYQHYRDFNNYLIESGIFITEEIEKLIQRLRDLMQEALSEAQIEHEHPNPRLDRWEKREALRKEGSTLVQDIKAAIKRRLEHTAITLD